MKEAGTAHAPSGDYGAAFLQFCKFFVSFVPFVVNFTRFY
jgi:hypothetical protein